MLIDVSDISTIPEEVEQKILERLNSLSPSRTSKIKAHDIQCNNDVDCAIENYIGEGVAYSFYQELIPVFNQYEIVCYHFTKILDKNIIFSEGLRTNEWDAYSKDITHTLQTLKVPEKDINQVCEVIKQRYERKYSFNRREPQLCFYLSADPFREAVETGYERFCENIGGELARQALKEDYTRLYRYLKENGEALLVKFKIPFLNIAWNRKSSIIYRIVAHFSARHFWNYEYQIHDAGYTDKAIPGSDILELIPYETARYY